MVRIWRWTAAAVLFALVFIAIGMGWIEGQPAIDAVMGAIALVGLFSTLGKPWDLYFQARATVHTQDGSTHAGIDVSGRDRAIAQQLMHRLLGLCLSLHVGAALVLTVVTWWTGGLLGYGFAAFFLIAILFRPIEVGYRHIRSQLSELESDARYPRKDVLGWIDTVKYLREEARHDAHRRNQLQKEHQSKFAELESSIREVDERARASERALDGKLDSVLRELDRTVDRLTDDRELVVGIRSLVKLIRGTG